MAGTGAVFLVTFLPLAYVSPLFANAASVGMLIGYTIYMVVHHACHFRMPMQTGYFYRIRLHHVVHHYSRDSGNFGVTTSFWDHVFGTRVKPTSVNINRRTSGNTRAPYKPSNGSPLRRVNG
jgi:sterol desaturase/sphingolipid hydroxylase (fatty acid hydroxylase superfamily)